MSFEIKRAHILSPSNSASRKSSYRDTGHASKSVYSIFAVNDLIVQH